MLVYVELLLRILGAAMQFPAPSSEGGAALLAAGVVGLAGGAVLILARRIVAANASFFGTPPRPAGDDATGIPALTCQSAPDAPGRPHPRAPGRPIAVAVS